MFLKSVKKIFSNRTSIKSQLTVFYTAASFFLVSCIAVFLYWQIINVLHQNDRQFLLDEMHVIQYLLEKNDTRLLQHEIIDVPRVMKNSIYHYSIRIIDPQNKIVMSTPGMENALHGIRTDFTTAEQITYSDEWWHTKHHDTYLLMRSIVNATAGRWIIEAALDISDQHEMIVKYRERAFIVMLAGMVFSIIIGYFIARKALRRMEELTEATKNITTLSLHQRISAKYWPKELRKLGMAFNDMLDRIEGAFSKLTQFSDDLAHELRTPINNLMNETEVILSQQHSLHDARQVLESNLEEFQRINHIIENILFLARTENPQFNLQKESLRVHDEIAVISEFYQAIADDKNIKITREGEAILSANQVMFRRMMSNLLSNALKYTHENGSVHITIKKIYPDAVEITVKDNGIGIPAEHLPKIFNRFHRVDAARSQHTGSVGLGLAIVKSIMTLHQGVVSITSELGRGTQISLLFHVTS
jgi:two-component system, OmpR family, heavy metal sensor histidine kinase CusS